MENNTIEIQVTDKGMLELLEALYYDYRAKQDIINSVFDIHKFDLDGSVIDGAPFKAYEKAFSEAKIKYDEMMETVQNTYIPEETRNAGCRWEVNFDESKIIVTPM